MALQRLKIEGHGQFENNRIEFGENDIEAMTPLSEEDFGKGEKCENGMLLAINKAGNAIEFPKVDGDHLIGLVFSTETYRPLEDPAGGRKSHYITIDGDYLPRLGIPHKHGIFTTNCLAYDTEEFTDDKGFTSTLNEGVGTGVRFYGCPSELGAIKITKEKPVNGLILEVIKAYTLPDGQFGVKLQVLQEQQ